MLFRLRFALFSSVISAALAYPMSSVCNTMKRERNGNQYVYSGRFHLILLCIITYVSVAGSAESLSHNPSPVGQGRRYSARSVQMRIADLNPDIRGRCASSAGMTAWPVNAEPDTWTRGKERWSPPTLASFNPRGRKEAERQQG